MTRQAIQFEQTSGPSQKGQTPLHVAALSHQATTMEFLVTRGADLEAVDNVRHPSKGHGVAIGVFVLFMTVRQLISPHPAEGMLATQVCFAGSEASAPGRAGMVSSLQACALEALERRL